MHVIASDSLPCGCRVEIHDDDHMLHIYPCEDEAHDAVLTAVMRKFAAEHLVPIEETFDQ